MSRGDLPREGYRVKKGSGEGTAVLLSSSSDWGEVGGVKVGEVAGGGR